MTHHSRKWSCVTLCNCFQMDSLDDKQFAIENSMLTLRIKHTECWKLYVLCPQKLPGSQNAVDQKFNLGHCKVEILPLNCITDILRLTFAECQKLTVGALFCNLLVYQWRQRSDKNMKKFIKQLTKTRWTLVMI